MNTTQATAKCTMKSWDEKPYNESEGTVPLVHAQVVNSYSGDIEAESALEYSMVYSSDGAAYFVGHERITGRLAERTGSFVLLHNGVFRDGVAQANWTVVPGSASGELRGLHGEGGYAVGHDQEYAFILNYYFAEEPNSGAE